MSHPDLYSVIDLVQRLMLASPVDRAMGREGRVSGRDSDQED